jgi:sirohydrochlorin cobaltochelatase
MTKDKKALLVVSFGTSHAETREKTIGAIEKDIADAYPEYEARITPFESIAWLNE